MGIVGRMSELKAVLASDPSMVLIGLEIFDQKYAGIKLNEEGRKHTLRSLMARGMVLGHHASSSKLLKKIAADSTPLWEARFFDALLRVYTSLPEQAVQRIWAFMYEARL